MTNITIAVVGCLHGELDLLYESLKRAEIEKRAKIDLVICCGDFQSARNTADLESMACPRKFRKLHEFHSYYSGEKIAPYLTIFIGGNHEASNFLWSLPYGGWVAKNIFYMGISNVISFSGVIIGGIGGIFKPYNFNKGHFEKPPFDDNLIRSIYHLRAFDFRKFQDFHKLYQQTLFKKDNYENNYINKLNIVDVNKVENSNEINNMNNINDKNNCNIDVINNINNESNIEINNNCNIEVNNNIFNNDINNNFINNTKNVQNNNLHIDTINKDNIENNIESNNSKIDLSNDTKNNYNIGVKDNNKFNDIKNNDITPNIKERIVFNSNENETKNESKVNVKNTKKYIDLLFSHDWPNGIWKHGNLRYLLNKKPFFKNDIHNNEFGCRSLMELLTTLKPNFYFCAHMHVDFRALVKHEDSETKFQALDKSIPRRHYYDIIKIHSDVDNKALFYVPEWLAITKLFAPYFKSSSNEIPEMPIPDEKYVEEASSNFSTFEIPPYVCPSMLNKKDRDSLDSEDQTVVFCKTLGIENPCFLETRLEACTE